MNAIILSRLFLNLRGKSVADAGISASLDTQASWAPPSRVIREFGGSLSFIGDDAGEDDLEDTDSAEGHVVAADGPDGNVI